MPELDRTIAETSLAKDLWNQAESMLNKHGQVVPPTFPTDEDFIKDTPNARIGSRNDHAYTFISGVYLSPKDNPNPVLKFITIMGSLTPDSDLQDFLALEKNLGTGFLDKPFVNLPDMDTMARATQILEALEQRYS
jgi:hypothetical protein